ncbi:hypothetical protein Tco_1257397, partial [Tanacetum coccineum]
SELGSELTILAGSELMNSELKTSELQELCQLNFLLASCHLSSSELLIASYRTSPNPRNQATVQDDRVVVQNVQGRQNRGQGNNALGAGATGYEGTQNRVGNANPGQAR